MTNYPIWHPYTQMQTAPAPVKIVRGEGALLYSENGTDYIDAISSWWTNLHGHGHPHIASRISGQAQQLEQVIFAGFTHQPAIDFAEQLLQHIPHHQKVFYSDNGSTAVEVAIKMALQYFENKGEERNTVVAFKDAYHGDTFGSMSVSARNVFTKPFHALLFDVIFIDTPNGQNDSDVLAQFESLLRSENGEHIAALIVEPLVLGSAGMLMYNAETLDALISMCKNHRILSIADEVMTGFYRTGKFLATDYCNHKPDIICLSKGITGGFLPFAATTCTGAVYNAFLSNEKSKMLFHGHSFTANPLGCAASLASLELLQQSETIKSIQHIEEQHHAFANQLKTFTSVKNVRVQGTILAFDIQTNEHSGYLNSIRDVAYAYFIEHGVLLRPLGNVVYILPPYCITTAQLQKVYYTIESFLLTFANNAGSPNEVDFT